MSLVIDYYKTQFTMTTLDFNNNSFLEIRKPSISPVSISKDYLHDLDISELNNQSAFNCKGQTNEFINVSNLREGKNKSNIQELGQVSNFKDKISNEMLECSEKLNSVHDYKPNQLGANFDCDNDGTYINNYKHADE